MVINQIKTDILSSIIVKLLTVLSPSSIFEQHTELQPVPTGVIICMKIKNYIFQPPT